MRYRVTINTDKYKLAPCSTEHWEAGTKNDYMTAINGRTFTEKNLCEIKWLLSLFQGIYFLASEYTETNSGKIGKYGEYFGMSERYYSWLHKRGHKVKYYDSLCKIYREKWLSGYGFCQGYFDKDKYISELKEKGKVVIPFKALYDIRQYDKNMNGCYMMIEKVH